MDNRKLLANAAASPPTAPASPSVGYPTDGGIGVPAATGGAYWFHSIAEEQRNVILGASITPSSADNTQLLTAIKKGFGQSWQDFTSTRSLGTTFTNTSGAPIFINVTLTANVALYSVIATINGQTVPGSSSFNTGSSIGSMFIVAAGATYSATSTLGTPTLVKWSEFR